MTDIIKLCDELEADLKAIESTPVEDRSFATYEVRRQLFNAAQPLIDAARESVKKDASYRALHRAHQDAALEMVKLRERIKELEQQVKEKGE